MIERARLNAEIAMVLEAPDVPLFNTAAVAQRTGLPAATFRAWERRYQFPAPYRDARGQRLYSERDIAAIRWLQNQTNLGVSISRAVAILQQGYVQPIPVITTGPSNAGGRNFGALQSDLVGRLLRFEADAAEATMREAFGLYNLEDVCLHIVQPTLIEIGERWHANEISVADEHYATAFLRTRLFSLLALLSGTGQDKTIFAACAEDEWHEVGLLMVSLFLARHGYNVRYLGANLPGAELVPPVRRVRPALVIYSAHSLESARTLPGVYHALHALPPPRPLFAYGGQAFNDAPELRTATPGTYLGQNAREAVRTVEHLLGRGA